MVALIIILGILLFLLFLLFAPATAEVGFEDKFTLKVRYLFFTVSILPSKSEEKPETKSKKKEKKPKEKKESSFDLRGLLKKEGTYGFLDALVDAVGILKTTSKRLISKIRLGYFDLCLITAGGADAAQGAVNYGKFCSIVYGACGVLFDLLPCEKKAVSVCLDYKAMDNKVSFSGEFSLRPIYVLREVFSVSFRGAHVICKFLRSNSRKESIKKGTRASENG